MTTSTLRSFLLCDLLLLFVLQSHGCTGGKAFDESGLPLVGAQAVCNDLPNIGPVYSDGTGVYKWLDGQIPEGPHTFTISKDTYQSRTVSVVVKYAPAPGHLPAEGLIFQIPDIKLQKIGAAKSGVSRILTTTTSPNPFEEPETKKEGQKPLIAQPASTLVPFTLPTLPPTTLPPFTIPLIIPTTIPIRISQPLPTATTLKPVFPTFPVLTLPQLATVTIPTVPASVPTTTQLPTQKIFTATMPMVTTTLANIEPPGQQWYESPARKYSFSAPLDWRVGFQGDQALLQYQVGACEAVRITIQVSNPRRPNARVVQESQITISSAVAQVRNFEDGTVGYFFSCNQNSFSIYKNMNKSCAGADIPSLERSVLMILTNFRCSQ